MRKAPAARNVGAATLAAVLCLGGAFASSASGEDVTIGPADLSGTTASAKCPGACTDTFVQLTQPTLGVAAPSFTPAVQGITSEFMTATVPAGVAGAVHVQVTGPGGASYQTSADLYSYVAPVFPQPSILIAAPLSGAVYKQGEAVTADYTCTAPADATVSACAGPVAKGAAIDTASPGSHTFTVTATASNGASASRSALYTVTAGPLGAGLGSTIGPGLAGEAPVIGNLAETVKRWREQNGPSRVGAKKKPPVGTTFSFTLNEPATVALRFTREATARRVHGRCVAPSRSNRNKPPCVRRIAAGAIVYAGHSGINRIRFLGRVTSTTPLRAANYTLSLTATDTQGRHSALPPRTLAFTIAR
ncbi:MAG: hypothetical protein H0X28_10270 [Solirubrobacterales bacterium]|nr:hypothetical protein [Solirubrobacterales bacterium]